MKKQMQTIAKKIEANQNTAFWKIEGSMNNDWVLVVEVKYVDIYSAGYVYDITAYCLDTGIKVIYQRVKSYRSLLLDKKAMEEYFARGGELCKTMTDDCFWSENIKKKDWKMLKEKTL